MSSQPPLVRVPCPVCGADRARPERVVHGYPLERCADCDMVFANPRYSDEVLLGGYDNKGEHADDIHSTDDLVAYYAHLTTGEVLMGLDRILADIESLTPKGRLLDFGCGAGYFMERAAKRGWEAHGVEVGSWAQEAARQRGVANLHQGLLADQQFPDGHFDVVVSSQVLEHLAHPLEDLAEMSRVLKPGGLLYSNVPNYKCLSIVLGRDDFESNHPMGHLNYFTPDTLSALLERAGFTTIRTASYGGLKWENLLGRRAVRPHHRQNQPTATGSANTESTQTAEPVVAQRSGLKKLVFPAVESLLYRRAQVGMELEIFARKA